MRLFKDTDSDEIITEDQLKKEYQELMKDGHLDKEVSFSDYVTDCTTGNGFLREVKND